jgi:hypothetical protein
MIVITGPNTSSRAVGDWAEERVVVCGIAHPEPANLLDESLNELVVHGRIDDQTIDSSAAPTMSEPRTTPEPHECVSLATMP